MSWGLSPDHADWWYGVSWVGIILCGGVAAFFTAGVVVFTMIQFWSDGIRDEQADGRNRAMEVQLAEANARTKEAELKAKELVVHIRRQQKPRQFLMSKEKFFAELKDQPVAPIQFRYDPAVYDAQGLTHMLYFLLREAGWPVEWNMTPIAAEPGKTGVYIDGGKGTEASAEALAKALLVSGATSSVNVGTYNSRGLDRVAQDGEVWVTVWQRTPSWLGTEEELKAIKKSIK